jgi:hypothetical protein
MPKDQGQVQDPIVVTVAVIFAMTIGQCKLIFKFNKILFSGLANMLIRPFFLSISQF